MKEGLFEVRCAWVHENCFYWEVIEYNIVTVDRLFLSDKIIKNKVARYELADISAVYNKAEERQWKYNIFTVKLDKTNL